MPEIRICFISWDSHNTNLVNILELVQNNAARFNCQRKSNKTSLSLSSLAAWHKISCLSFFHKIFHHPTLHDMFIHYPHYVSHRIDHSHKVYVSSSNTNTFFESFVPRTSLEWNCLPQNIVCISDNSLFCTGLNNIAN